MIWGLVTALALIGVLAVGLATGPIARRVVAHSLRRTGRTITWQDALAQVQKENGFFVENYSSLPGRLWWVSCRAPANDAELYSFVRDRGLMITEVPTEVAEILASNEIREHVRRLHCSPLFNKGTGARNGPGGPGRLPAQGSHRPERA